MDLSTSTSHQPARLTCTNGFIEHHKVKGAHVPLGVPGEHLIADKNTAVATVDSQACLDLRSMQPQTSCYSPLYTTASKQGSVPCQCAIGSGPASFAEMHMLCRNPNGRDEKLRTSDDRRDGSIMSVSWVA